MIVTYLKYEDEVYLLSFALVVCCVSCRLEMARILGYGLRKSDVN